MVKITSVYQLTIMKLSLPEKNLSFKLTSSALFGVVVATALAAPMPALAIDVSPTAWWDVIGRDLKMDNAQFTSVGSGTFIGNTAFVNPGSPLNLSFDWIFGGATSDTSYCPGCIIQNYVAWIQPSQTVNSSAGSMSGVFSSPSSQSSGSFSWITQAPTEPGTYYIGSAATLDYVFQPDRPGTYGGPTSVGPYGNVAPFKIVVAVPGPIPFLGVASAFAYSRRLRNRVRDHKG